MPTELMRRRAYLGGPGVGKSTAAADTYARMKRAGLSVELAREFVKDMAYDGIRPEGFDQLWVFASQVRIEERLLQHVDYVVTDCPPVLCAAYAAHHNTPGHAEMLRLAQEFEDRYPAINMIIPRENHEYDRSGRLHTLYQALKFDDFLLRFLDRHRWDFQVIPKGGCVDAAR